jgi:hypothetical protein
MRTHPWLVPAVLVAGVLVAPGAALPAAGQSAFPLGSFEPVRVPSAGTAELVVQASGAGFLTVIVRSDAGEDLTLSVTDEDFQVLPGAHGDMDIGGNVGAEQLVVGIPHAGTYRVLVETLGGGGASVRAGGAFLASELAATPRDPDGRPGEAASLAVGETHQDEIEPAEGDGWDWYRIAVESSGVLTVLTRSDGEGDLRLEIYRDGSFREAANSSDQDIDGVLGNESLTWDVQAGSVVYVRVAPALTSGDRVAYRIMSGLIPG